MNYLILQNPGHNRVYYIESEKLALAELKIACDKLSLKCSNIKIKEISNIKYISFSCDENITESDLEYISNLSFCFAIFKEEIIDKSSVLYPISKTNKAYIDEKISNLLKYKGKTNELFTKMMINIASITCNTRHNNTKKLLDPVAGKGTTLYEASIYGFNAYGIEIEAKSVHELEIFFKKFLETEKIKHKSNKRRIHSINNKEIIFTNEFSYHKKADSENEKILAITEGNSEHADKYYKKASFDMIVGDLPYGISHGNKNSTNLTGSKTRNPSEFLKFSLPAWQKTLKTHGSIVLAWNSNVISKHKVNEIFKACDFEIIYTDLDFEHMVDKSIKRDIIIARKK
ncbi:MAG: hypothetical protein N4A49_03615 [Marinifilaceae bacterium]|jgi:hypothetical protein|nr:hypothetical protein [Marinifilaceae bacterium]